MNNNIKVAIVGARQSGKTTMSLALSHLWNIPRVHAKTINTINEELFPGKDPSHLEPHQLLSLGLARYTDRVVQESEAEQGFISDGSVLNEMIYGTVRMKMAAESETLLKKVLRSTLAKPASIIGRRIRNEYAFCLKYHAKTTYDAFIYLDWRDSNPGDLSQKEQRFRELYDEMLLTTLDELGVPCYQLTGPMEKRLEAIQELFSFSLNAPIDDAISVAQAQSSSMEREYHYA